MADLCNHSSVPSCWAAVAEELSVPGRKEPPTVSEMKQSQLAFSISPLHFSFLPGHNFFFSFANIQHQML